MIYKNTFATKGKNMATIKDIALMAGVSQGTVSNVINKKGNVSSEKIYLVEKAARELGYQINATAKNLRQGTSKEVCLIVPRIESRTYNDLFLSLNDLLTEEDYDLKIYFSNDQYLTEKHILEKIVSSNPSTVITVTSFTKKTSIFNLNTRFIFLDRLFHDLPPEAITAGFDFFSAGTDLAQKCISDQKQRIALLCGNENYSNYSDFIAGAKQVLENENCWFEVFSTQYSLCLNKAFEISTHPLIFDAVITTDMEFIEQLRKAYKYSKTQTIPEFYTLASKDTYCEKDVHAYFLNYKALGRKLGKYIIKTDNEKKTSPSQLKVKNDGFVKNTDYETFPESENKSINFLILKSPVSSALKLLLPDFTNKTGITVRLIEDEYSTLESSVKDSIDSKAYDLIRMDMLWLSNMAKNTLMPLDPDDPMVKDITNLISPAMPEDYYRHDGIMYSFPFDASVQLLYYRKDLFSDALIKREFYETTKKQLELPKTYEDFMNIACFFTKKYNKFSPTKYGTSLVCGNAVVASCDFLPRIKCQNISLVDSNGKIIVDQPPIKQALEKYVETNNYTPQDLNTWWEGSIRDFAYENTAMIVIFSNYASLIINQSNSKVIGNTGFSAIPGNSPLLGGGIVGISKNSCKKNECLTFLKWLYSEEIAGIITRLGGYINNKNLSKNAELLELYPWIEGMEKAFKIGTRNYSCTQNSSFEEYKFEEILGHAIRASITGVLSINDALKEAQQKCDIAFGNHSHTL